LTAFFHGAMMDLMRRALSILVIVAVVCLSIMGALASIEHTHGKDSDHSKTESCPICQFSIQGFSATITDFSSIIVSLFVLHFLFSIIFSRASSSYQSVSARAPPVLL